MTYDYGSDFYLHDHVHQNELSHLCMYEDVCLIFRMFLFVILVIVSKINIKPTKNSNPEKTSFYIVSVKP